MGDSSTFPPQNGEFCSNICHEQNLYYNPCVMEMIFCDFHNYEPFGLGRFATDHSLTKAASRPLFARVRRYAPQRDH